jgi:hypothetical protein
VADHPDPARDGRPCHGAVAGGAIGLGRQLRDQHHGRPGDEERVLDAHLAVGGLLAPADAIAPRAEVDDLVVRQHRGLGEGAVPREEPRLGMPQPSLGHLAHDPLDAGVEVVPCGVRHVDEHRARLHAKAARRSTAPAELHDVVLGDPRHQPGRSLQLEPHQHALELLLVRVGRPGDSPRPPSGRAWFDLSRSHGEGGERLAEVAAFGHVLAERRRRDREPGVQRQRGGVVAPGAPARRRRAQSQRTGRR